MARTRNNRGWLDPGPQCYDQLLEYPCVRDFLIMLQSDKTKDDYMRYLNVLVGKSGLSPPQLLELDSDAARKTLMRVVRDEYLAAGKETAARLMQTAIRTFYEINEKTLEFKRIDRIRRVRKKVAYEHVPTKEEVYRMADVYYRSTKRDLRNCAIILSLFQSGVRVGCLLNWKVEMVRSQLYPEIKIPVNIRITNAVDSKLNGYGLAFYHTFLGLEAATSLKRYLDYRIEQGEELEDDDYVFTHVQLGKNKKIDKNRVLTIVKHAAEKIGLKATNVWTHTLRKSFRKVLNASPIDEDTREVLMGHKLPGSRGNYFDYHDVNEIMVKYTSADFALYTPQARLNILEEERMKMEEKLAEKSATIEELKKRLDDLEVIYQERLKVKE